MCVCGCVCVYINRWLTIDDNDRQITKTYPSWLKIIIYCNKKRFPPIYVGQIFLTPPVDSQISRANLGTPQPLIVNHQQLLTSQSSIIN